MADAPTITTDWFRLSDGKTYAQAQIGDLDWEQRLVAHAEHDDPAQLADDLRALARAALDLAFAIDTAERDTDAVRPRHENPGEVGGAPAPQGDADG